MKTLNLFVLMCVLIHSFIFSHESHSFENFWKEVQPSYEEIVRHPFIQEMVSGQLSPSKYLNYSQQDAFFMMMDCSSFESLSKIAPSSFEKSYLMNVARESEEVMPILYQKYIHNASDLKLWYEVEFYMMYLSDAVQSASYHYAAGALMACMISYAYISNHLFDRIEPSNPYYHWFDENKNYLSEAIEFVDYVLRQAKTEEYHDFVRGFMLSMNFESIFWDVSYFH